MKAKYVKEYFLFPDISIMCLIFLISFGFLIPNLTSIGLWIALVVGMAAYSAAEYFTHRFLFHMRTPKKPFFLKILKRLHYDHHASPNDLHLLFLPLWYSLPNMAIAGAAAYLITSSLVITIAFIDGVILFLLFYEMEALYRPSSSQPNLPLGALDEESPPMASLQERELLVWCHKPGV
ncbi:hypothetical protein GCM10010913_31100 [Paenibacillus aceti]|uniref:Fatty acid hydroxylase n=1 Tax=Paenibacillus aceti TaxID=1820010 RepID=A0ABQ1VZI6_9BACL|nr:hypothetical protein GCM10010913_31100 [Paenibacillus aceti]